MSEGKDKVSNGPIVPVQAPSLPKVNAQASNGLRLRSVPPGSLRGPSVLRRHDLRLRNGPPASPRVPNVLRLRPHGRRLRSGPMLPAPVLSGPWTGVRLPASSNVQPARVSVCASAPAVRS